MPYYTPFRGSGLCRSNGSCFFRGHGSGRAPFLMYRNGAELFKDVLFDLVNESDQLDIIDIQADDKNNGLTIIDKDGYQYTTRIETVE